MLSLQAALELTEQDLREATAARDQLREDLIGECMRAQGFEYTAFIPPEPDNPFAGLSESEFRARFGFGISTLVGMSPDQADTTNDPNAEYRSSLDAGAAEAYDKEFSDCLVIADQQLPSPPGLVQFSGEVGRLYQDAASRAEADPRMNDANKQWIECMTDAGYAYETREAMLSSLYERAEPYVNEYATATAGSSESLPLRDIFSGARLSDLRQLQEEERAVAAAEAPCFQALDAVQGDLHTEYLQQMIDDYWNR